MNLFGVFVCTLFVLEGEAVRNFHGLCPMITIPNGRVRYRQRGKIARILCNTGYILAGDRYSVCAAGKWDNVVSKCVRASCKDAKPPVDGLIYPSHGGAVLNFYCKSGFELNGANITYCDGVKWNNPLPTCLETKSKPSLSCDFESPTLCGWNHDLNHDFDWKRLNYATPSGSIGTGPSYDHTKGYGKDGYYMYIESSARNINDTARLISPVYDSTMETTCFEFFYHMYGVTTGSLRVYLKRVDQPWNLNVDNALFVKNGNQGNKWYRGLIVLGAIDKEFQIVIEGVRGTSYVSDIAIDDVKIITNCDPDDEQIEETTTEETISETPISVESCENRCNTNDSRSVNWLITCDCDEGCYERNRCCPDYFDYCVIGISFDEETTTEVFTSTIVETVEIQTSPTKKKTTLMTVSVGTTEIKDKDQVIVEEMEKDFEEVLPVTQAVQVETPGVPIKETESVNDYESKKSYNQKIQIGENGHESNTKTIVFAIGVVFGVLFASVGMTFVARRYQLCRCRNMKLYQSSNGDSQSDVRFLTSDEVLDFSLAADYDTL